MTNRTRGDYFERQARAALEARGWWIIRSGGSLGEADLVAFRDGKTPRLIACKINGKIPAKERIELLQVAKQCGDVYPMLAHRPQPGFVRFVALLPSGADVEEEILPVPRRPR